MTTDQGRLLAGTSDGSVDPGRVFVVDRDPHIHRLLQQFLAGLYEVEFFDDGYAALDRARSSPPPRRSSPRS